MEGAFWRPGRRRSLILGKCEGARLLKSSSKYCCHARFWEYKK
jgi:hypothetical protein